MKKIYLFIFLLTCTLFQAQTTTTATASGSVTTSGSITTNSSIKNHDRYYNSWRFGINLGATWETADVRSTPGFAGGFTLEKGFCENKTNFLSWALKFRGLWGTAYGLDYTRNHNVKFNPALNGTYNRAVNYDSTSDYVYNNYRTQIAEGALEFQINFNSLRERTNILLNLWAGIGYTSYRVKTNLLDANNKMYNYYAVDSSGGTANIISSHKFLLDGSYESNAQNSQNGNVLTWSPSCGVGLGYRFNDYVSILWEYKLTFPQGTYSDYLDGIKGSNNDKIGCVKDYYHYTCLNFLFKLGGRHKSKSTSNVNSYTPVNTNTYVSTNSVTTTQPVIPKPIVNITNPPYSPYYETANPSFTVNAKLYNVNHRNEVNITFNNAVVTNYSWIGKFVSFVVPLNVGANVVTITATNVAGSDSKSATINYNGIPPQITITNPGASQHITTQSMQDLNATVLNVASASDISIKFNGAAFNSFGFNPADHSLYMQLPLAKGANTVDITAVNTFGKDYKSQIIIYNLPTTVVTATGTASRPVVVTITDPNVNPYKSQQSNYHVKAKVSGVSSANQVTVTANNTPVAFNYLNGFVDFDLNLGVGNTFVLVSASNGKSSDAKSTVLTYEITSTEVGIDPDITICHQRNGIKQTLVIKQSEWAGHQQHGDVMGACPKIEGTDVGIDPDITICHKNPDGSKQTIVVKQSTWSQHQLHGDVMGTCPKVEGTDVGIDPDITICHNKQTITIKQSQWASHQAHGDVMGACPKLEGSDAGFDPDITICHKNGDGTETKMVIKQSQWPTHQAHGDYQGGDCATQTNTTATTTSITICHKNEDGSTVTMSIPSSQWSIHRAHGDIMGPCPPPEDKKITICHIPPGNNSNPQTIEINESAWPAHQAHGDTKGACPTQTVEPEDKKITICHIPPGNPNNPQTIEINESAWPAHLAHGDSKGACPTQTVEPEDKKITICHIPPGNPNNPQTIEINESAWPAHLAHGDSKGACPTQTVTPEDKKITICHIPPGNHSNPQTIEINESAWPAHQAHGDTKGACPVQKTVNPEGDGGIKQPKSDGEIKSPGRTNQSQQSEKTVEPAKTTEQPKVEEAQKLKPR